MFRFIKNFLRWSNPHKPCPCGGTIREIYTWEQSYYCCDRCGTCVTEAEFENKT